MFVTSAFAADEGHSNAAHGETHSETGVANDGGHSGAFPPFDASTYPSQLLWLAITFGLFYMFLKKTIVPRISGILEVRHDRIAQDLDQAARMKEESDKAIAAYEQELADARTKANAIAQEARENAKLDAQNERDHVTKALDAKLSEAENSIAAVKNEAMKEVSAIAQDTAEAMIEALSLKATKSDIAAAVKAAQN